MVNHLPSLASNQVTYEKDAKRLNWRALIRYMNEQTQKTPLEPTDRMKRRLDF